MATLPTIKPQEEPIPTPLQIDTENVYRCDCGGIHWLVDKRTLQATCLKCGGLARIFGDPV